MATTKHFLVLFSLTLLSISEKTDQTLSNIVMINITKGSTLHTNSTISPNFWPSPSGHFAFGFYPSGNNGNFFRVGIWIVGTPRNAVVWTALRHDPEVPSGSVILFSNDGKLLLLSSLGGGDRDGGKLIAETNETASVASMKDSGNFVLYDSDMEIVWGSFHHPTNTILVKQELVSLNGLYSSKSETDDSIGDFRLWMSGDGNLFASPLTSLLNGADAYWFTGRSPGTGSNVSLTLAADGRLYLQNSTGFAIKKLAEGGLPVDETNLYRATFDVDGVIRLYGHEMGTNGSLSVKILWEAIGQEDRCSVKGICGLNSYCTLNDSDVVCLCPPGFDYVDQDQPREGCFHLNFSDGSDCLAYGTNDRHSVSSVENTWWEQDAFNTSSPLSEEECSEACLQDCHCEAAMLRNQTCFMLKLPLRYGNQKYSTSEPTKSFFKIREGEPMIKPKKKSSLVKKLVISNVVLVSFSLIVFLSSAYLIYKHRISGYKKILTVQQDIIEEINLRSFSYKQIAEATNNFREEIGRGASGKVYKGLLTDNHDNIGIGGKEIAVKKLEKVVEEGEREFRNEMKIIGRCHHRNLVRLIGYCAEGSNRLLVYEFMKNGSLGKLIFNSGSEDQKPSWRTRTKISLEIAKGLHYLHEECETKIIHCDVKPHNVLMDETWRAKISDFGLSKLLKPDQTRTYTRARGTLGYEAPEWHKNNTPVTTKVDVYSFGVMLLEIVCCRKNLDLTVPDEEMMSLMSWAYKCYESGEVMKLGGGKDADGEEMEKMVKIGLWCVQTEPSLRPTMKEVVLMMDDTIVTPPPPPPSPTS